jgi:alpha-galactosidase
MTLSSDKLSGLRRPITAVRLSVAPANASQREAAIGRTEEESIYFEMDRHELGQFIKTLKNAQKVLGFPPPFAPVAS